MKEEEKKNRLELTPLLTKCTFQQQRNKGRKTLFLARDEFQVFIASMDCMPPMPLAFFFFLSLASLILALVPGCRESLFWISIICIRLFDSLVLWTSVRLVLFSSFYSKEAPSSFVTVFALFLCIFFVSSYHLITTKVSKPLNFFIAAFFKPSMQVSFFVPETTQGFHPEQQPFRSRILFQTLGFTSLI